jgi:hypothetical protein
MEMKKKSSTRKNMEQIYLDNKNVEHGTKNTAFEIMEYLCK